MSCEVKARLCSLGEIHYARISKLLSTFHAKMSISWYPSLQEDIRYLTRTYKSFKKGGKLSAFIKAGLLSVCYSCGGGTGGNSDKRSYLPGHYDFSLDFQTLDFNGDGLITLAEFLDLQPGHEQLFNDADTDGSGTLTCAEFSREVKKYGGEANC